jgi:hypothetical protein
MRGNNDHTFQGTATIDLDIVEIEINAILFKHGNCKIHWMKLWGNGHDKQYKTVRWLSSALRKHKHTYAVICLDTMENG